jgi:hypothetical protein
MSPSVGLVRLWTHDKKVDLPHPGSPKSSIVTVVSVPEGSCSAILLALSMIVILYVE